MADGVLHLNNNLKKILYWPKIVSLEQLHPQDLRESSFEKLKDLFTKGSISVIYVKDKDVLGECNAVPLERAEHHVLENIVDSECLEYYLTSSKTLYVNSIGVSTKAYSRLNAFQIKGNSIAMQMNSLLKDIATQQGYDHILGHAREGMSVNVALKLGARIIKKYDNWYGVGTPYYLVQLDLKK